MSRILDTITKDNVNIPFIGPDGNVVGTPLFSAISEDRMDYIDQFIELGADVNIVVNYETPLIAAILKGNIDVVNRLLLADADPNLIPDRDYSPLGVAVCRHNIDIIKLLMSFGANINYEDRNRTSSVLGMLLLSRRYDLTPESYDVFNFLFQNGLDISRSIHDWVSFLLIKLIDTYSDFIDGLKILKLFLEYCANPNIDYVIRKTFGYRRTHYDDNLILMLLLGGTIFEENFLENMITYNRLSSISYISRYTRK